MTDIQRATAYNRLGQIADIGYSILLETAESGLQLLASTHSPEWSQDVVLEWEQSGDPVLRWINGNIGSIPVNEVDGEAKLVSGLPDGNCTVVSLLCSGARLGIVLSHTREALDEADLNEAKAAALVIQTKQSIEAETGVTTKELIYLKQVGAGATDDEIATELQLSLRAVKERKRKAIDDLRAKNIAHAIGIAKRSGLI